MKIPEPILPINPESDYDKQLHRKLYDYLRPISYNVNHPDLAIVVPCSDETTVLTTGAGKTTFRMPYGMGLIGARASLTTAQTSGSIFTVDINDSGSSVLSTKITVDNTEKTSTTAATQPVITFGSEVLKEDTEISIDIDQIGDGTAKGLKVTLIGRML